MRKRDGTRASDYDYELPAGRIALYPADRRDESRLLVVAPRGEMRHGRFHDLVGLLDPGDVLVVNESRVMPVRLLGRKPTGAPSEILLLRPAPGGNRDAGALASGRDASKDAPVWEALVRPGSKLKPGRTVLVGEDLRVEILDSTEGSGRLVRLITSGTVEQALERHGHVPLPPYITRPDEPIDRERYQTVYAREPGSVAAPTAGLHFTESMLREIDARGVVRVPVTLHVGVGTFRPLEGDDPAGHAMHREDYEVPAATARAVAAARSEGRRVWAVGTTVVRALEAAATGPAAVRAGKAGTTLFIRPPYEFRTVDCLVTNFHLPRSTLLMLVAAFAGYDRTMRAYAAAIEHGYRFYSYGDAMTVLRR